MVQPESDLAGFRPYMINGGEGLRNLLLKNGYIWACAICGLTEWLGQSAPLQVDHEDGNKFNNNRSNLRFLCPNCHALTPTFNGRNRRGVKVELARAVAAYDLIKASGVEPTLSSVIREMGYPSRVPDSHARLRVRETLFAANRVLAYYADDDEAAFSGHPRSRRQKDPIKWPSDDALVSMVVGSNMKTVARELGVSYKTFLNRLKSRGLSARIEKTGRSPRTVSPATGELRKERSRQRRLDTLAGCHGTRKGYVLELRLGLPRCEKCRAANVAATQESKARRAGHQAQRGLQVPESC